MRVAPIGCIASSLVLWLAVAGSVTAQEADRLDSVIRSVDQAYQVSRLQAAHTVRLEEERRSEFDSHDFGPSFHDLTRQRFHFVLNLRDLSLSGEYLTEIANTFYHAREVFADGEVRLIDYGNNRFQDQGPAEFFELFGPTIRSSDVLLANFLVTSRDSARLVGTENWLGRAHTKVELDLPGSPPLTLFVQEETGFITKMTRTLQGGVTVYYTFDDHTADDGFLSAREHSVFANGGLLYFSFNRRVVVDDLSDRLAFTMDAGVYAEPSRADQSTMTVEAVRPNSESEPARIHHVGVGEAYSTFVRTSDGVTAFGTETGFSDRWAAYQDAVDGDPVLRYAIVPDHHRSEMAGALEAVALGATLIATAQSNGRILELLRDAGVEGNVEAVQEPTEVGGVSVVPVATAHASQLLVAFHQANRVLMQSGHYASPYAGEPFYVKYTAVTLASALRPLAFVPEVLLSTASRKPEAWSDFATMVASYNRIPCHRQRAICQRG